MQKSAIHAQAPMLRNRFSDANWIKVADYQKFCAAEMFRPARRFTLPQVLPGAARAEKWLRAREKFPALAASCQRLYRNGMGLFVNCHCSVARVIKQVT